MDIMSSYVSQNLHHGALRNIFYAPMSFFDTTVRLYVVSVYGKHTDPFLKPLGRILSVFGKDIDSQLS
jgi:hypothetical protein